MTVLEKKVKKICCIGAGYVGGPTCAVIAMQNQDLQVTVVDLNQDRISAWRSDELPVFEPGLYDIVKLARDGDVNRSPNLFFSADVSQAIDDADMIFISVNTPTKTTGTGAGYAADLAYVESAARCIAEAAQSDKIIVEKSTVPCGTASNLRAIFDALAPNLHFDILSNPEFLAEGTAVKDLINPDRVLIGSLSDERSVDAVTALADIYATWVPRSRIITINLWSSELAKLAANCMLAQRISSINSFSAICEAIGADVGDLAHAVGMDTRIGSRMLKPSVGFGGSCFKKDVYSLVYIAECLHLPEVADYWRSVISINEYQKDRITKRIIHQLNNTLWGKKVAILGFAYKKNTGDTRESAAISIIHQLLAEKAQVTVFDPKVSEAAVFAALEQQQSPRDVQVEMIRSRVTVCSDATTACANASAVVIMTEWDHFKTDALPEDIPEEGLWLASSSDESTVAGSITPLSSEDSVINVAMPLATASCTHPSSETSRSERVDWFSIARVVRRPGLVFDGRDVVDPRKLAKLGFRVESIGKPTTMMHVW